MSESRFDPTFVAVLGLYGSLVAVLAIAVVVRRMVGQHDDMREPQSWVATVIGAVHFAGAFFAVTFLTCILAIALWSMKGLVVEPARVLVQEFGRIGDRPKALAIICIATSAAAASMWFIVRRINRRDDPKFAYLPDDPDSAP